MQAVVGEDPIPAILAPLAVRVVAEIVEHQNLPMDQQVQPTLVVVAVVE
jgi:hypothetical protein